MTQAVYLERSPAKINLILNVLEKRADGYHDIETLFQALELSDHLTFEINFKKGQSENLDFELEIDSNSETIKQLGNKNIIAKAIELYFSELPEKVINNLASISIKIFLDKNIPIEAGLAGGSSNGAATLRVLDRFFKEHFDFDCKNLENFALLLGSDLPFCLHSTTKAKIFAQSRGEKFSKRDFDFNFDEYSNLVLVKPDFGISTAYAYQALSGKTKSKNDTKPFFNSFEKVVYDEAPKLLEIHEALTKAGADKVMLSGSGSTMLAFFKDLDKAYQVQQSLKETMPETYFIEQTSFLNK